MDGWMLSSFRWNCVLTLSSPLKVCDRTTSPQWNEAFSYMVRDPREDILVVKVDGLQQTVWLLMCQHSVCVNPSVLCCVCVCPVLPQLDSAHRLPGGSYQRAAVRTRAGPGPVVPPGRSLTRESGSSESWTEGFYFLLMSFSPSHNHFSLSYFHSFFVNNCKMVISLFISLTMTMTVITLFI